MPVRLVDKANPIPRYLQVRRILEESIRSGQYRPGVRLPGERDLARDLNVSQMTVNKAVQALVQDGWLHRESGNGTFVREDFRVPAPEVVRIGFVSPVSSDHLLDDLYLGSLFRGIQRVVVNEPVSMTLLEAPGAALFERLIEAPLDGFLIAAFPEQSIPAVRRLREAGKRIVLLGASWGTLPVPCVDSDNLGGMRTAVRHLIGLGHRRLGGVFAFMGACNSQHRRRGFEEGLQEAGLSAHKDQVLELENDDLLAGALSPGVERMLRSERRPTAFVCGGFALALETMRTVQRAGLRVPDDVSVIGFDDSVSAHHLSPPLTTVRQPLSDMGQKAMQDLLRWLTTHEEPPLREVLPTELVVRESTAPVPAGGLP